MAGSNNSRAGAVEVTEVALPAEGQRTVEPSARGGARPFTVGLLLGVAGGLVLGLVIVGLFGADLSTALRQLARLIRHHDDDSVNFELLLQ